MTTPRNWAGNVAFSPARTHRPTTLAELQHLVSASTTVKALGTGHSFNHIADTHGDHITLDALQPTLELDSTNRRVRVSAATRYADLNRFLHRHGHALRNTGSLPHISVAGSIATGTHGSGNDNPNLAALVTELDMITADGDTVTINPDTHPDTFHGAVVSLGALGITTHITLEVIPTYDVRQHVYDITDEQLHGHLDQIMADGYSVSVFTDWSTNPRRHQIWRKTLVDPAGQPATGWVRDPAPWAEFHAARTERHPIRGLSPHHATSQLGQPGPWHTRLPHFRAEMPPSAGDELQTEYFVARTDARRAWQALRDLSPRIAALVQVTELRTVAADGLWLSPSFQRDSFCLHFTWRRDSTKVMDLLPKIEQRLRQFDVRPHWGKLFSLCGTDVTRSYPRFHSFTHMRSEWGPKMKFNNSYLDYQFRIPS